MRIEVDISDCAIGGVLLIECENSWWRLIICLLNSLNKTERNYKIYDKEMLKVIRELEALVREHKIQVWGPDRL